MLFHCLDCIHVSLRIVDKQKQNTKKISLDYHVLNNWIMLLIPIQIDAILPVTVEMSGAFEVRLGQTQTDGGEHWLNDTV